MNGHNDRALILFAHGARRAEWAQPFLRLQEMVRTASPGTFVGLAYLELMTPGLPEVVAEAVAQGSRDIVVIPVFLGQGGHVRKDLQELVAQQQALYPQLQLRVATTVGEDAGVLQAMANYVLTCA